MCLFDRFVNHVNCCYVYVYVFCLFFSAFHVDPQKKKKNKKKKNKKKKKKKKRTNGQTFLGKILKQ